MDCMLPLKEGYCSKRIPSYYYDPTINSCEPFYYRGHGGNNNRFDKVEQCEELCVI